MGSLTFPLAQHIANLRSRDEVLTAAKIFSSKAFRTTDLQVLHGGKGDAGPWPQGGGLNWTDLAWQK